LNEIDEIPIAPPEATLSEREGKSVYSPRTTEEIAAVARHAHANNLAIEITGSGTKRSWGNPVAADLLLDTTRVNRILEHPWQDLTCTVEAGCLWSDLQQTLARHNQFVALDPLWPTRATVGGIVATNDSGALRHRYGSLRDLILGMTLVLADGTIARTGGKVVKNVAGYDLHKLMIGGFGTLGVIAEVTFRLHPLPLHAETFTVSAPQAGQLAALMAAIRNSHLLTQGLQLRGNSQGFHLDIQLNAHPDAKQPALLATMTKAAGLSLVESTDVVWQARESLFENAEAFTLKATMLPASVTAIAEYVARCGATSVIQSKGIAFIEMPAPDHNSVMHIEQLEDLVEKEGGSVTILKNPASLKHDLDVILSEPAALPLMREIKRQFDPERILNPGRFLGGI
jgi:glycolate oxidase FAD binding subunit